MPSSQCAAGPHRADIDNVNLDDYNIHVIASVFKQWLRDLPNPLMTFELYEEFLRAMGKGHPFPLLQDGLRLDIRKKVYNLRVVRPRSRLPREALDAPSLEVLKVRLDWTLCSFV